MSASLGTAPVPAEQPLKRKIAAILAADVAGYSRLVAADEEGTLRALADARTIFDARIARGGGRIFNTAGDSVMCEFDSAVEAVRAAIEIQAALADRNAGLDPERRLLFRIGITIGDVVERGSDLLGDGVNIAARLEAIASPGGICISRSVQEAVAGKIAAPSRPLGARRLKNIPQALEVFEIAADALASGAPGRNGGGLARSGRGRRRLVVLGAVLGVAFVVVPALEAVRHAIERLDPGSRSRTEQALPAPPAGEDRRQNEAASPPSSPTPPKTPPQRSAQRRPGEAAPPRPEAAASLPDLYRAGREAEARGDRAAALKAYAAALPLAGEAVDLPLCYAALLSAEKGPAAARKALAEAGSASTAVELAAAATGDAEQRRRRLQAFANAHPDDAPGQYLMVQAMMDGAGGSPTLTERRLAHEALERFLDAASAGALASRFADRSLMESWVAKAKGQQASIEASFAAGPTRPTASFTRTSQGWLAKLALPEPAIEVSTRLGERGELQPTGSSGAIDSRTGRPAPNLEVELPAVASRRTLYVAYKDASGHDAGPFPIAFDPNAAGVASGREALERYPESWVSFRPDIPTLLSYAGLVSNRCAIARATIGFGAAQPKTALPLPPCDSAGPATMPSGSGSVLPLPEGVDEVSVQLTYADGTESPVRTFRRP